MVKGPKGELVETLNSEIAAEIKDGFIQLSLKNQSRELSAIYGTSRARLYNMICGVSFGFTKILDIVGLGYKAEATGQKLTLSLGKSHPVLFEIPKGISAVVDAKKTQVTLSGANKEHIGEIAAKLRSLRPPEPYKGTGIRYHGEHVRKKAGKTAAGVGAGAGGAKK